MEYLCPIFLEQYEAGFQKGFQKGFQEGLEESILKGEARMLLRVLQCKFGALPAEVHARVGSASAAELEQWVDQILVMDNLSDVLI